MRRTLVLTLVCAVAVVSPAAAQGLVTNGRLPQAPSVRQILKTTPLPATSPAAAPETLRRAAVPVSRAVVRQNGMSTRKKVVIAAVVAAGAIVGIVAATGGYSDDNPDGPYSARRR
jgi:hypothetical protein